MNTKQKAWFSGIALIVLFGLLLIGYVAGYTKASSDTMNNPAGIPVEKNGLAVSLRADKQEYHLQDTIQAKVRFENVSHEGFLINTMFQYHSIDYWFRFEDEKGEIYDDSVRLNPRGWFYGVHGFSYLQTKEAIEITNLVEISNYLQKPGTYTLSVIYGNDTKPDQTSYTHPDNEVRIVWTGIISAKTLIHVMP
jgi:hypothetical protein